MSAHARNARGGRHRILVWLVLLIAMTAGFTAIAAARSRQLGALASPGALSRLHADLEGIRQCQACHEPGARVSARRCLSCHKPIAARIAARRGVHRAVTTDCVTCHVEHMGRDAELRPFDTRRFDHARDGGYPLDGRHAAVAAKCSACHKTRSFLTASPACGSCHRDPHRGSLGTACETCHRTSEAFADAVRTFDHAKTPFPLTGAHGKTACGDCHPRNEFAAAKGATCATCHDDPHARKYGARCETCHASASWRTTRVDHGLTRYPLEGLHARVPCGACHVQPALRVRPAYDRCSACHADPHAGAFTQDCAACHSVGGFAKAPFDHGTTTFPLTGAHRPLACAACHTPAQPAPARGAPRTVAFGGLDSACGSCHADPHRGELGAACATCHRTDTFRVAAFSHAGEPAFFSGAHAGVACDRCHVPSLPEQPIRTAAPVLRVRYKDASRTCSRCHADVHLGQVGSSCESCHSIGQADFALAGFSHDRARFRLEGRHRDIACRTCHPVATARFPAGPGTAVRLTGLAVACASCHDDPHAGELGRACEDCHTAATFRIDRYAHRDRSLRAFFGGAHAAARCEQCHRRDTPSQAGPAARRPRYRIETRCARCHLDPHRGQLGDRCDSCHRAGVIR